MDTVWSGMGDFVGESRVEERRKKREAEFRSHVVMTVEIGTGILQLKAHQKGTPPSQIRSNCGLTCLSVRASPLVLPQHRRRKVNHPSLQLNILHLDTLRCLLSSSGSLEQLLQVSIHSIGYY